MSPTTLAALAALVLEVVHFATTRDQSLSFLALVLLTLGVLLEAFGPFWRRGP